MSAVSRQVCRRAGGGRQLEGYQDRTGHWSSNVVKGTGQRRRSIFHLSCSFALLHSHSQSTHTHSSPRVLRHGIVGVACQAAQPVWAAQQWQPVQASDQGNCSPCNQKKTLPLAARRLLRLLLLLLQLLVLLRLHLGLANVFSGSGSGGTCCELFTATGGLRFLRREAGAGRSSSLCGHYTAPEAFECVYVEASIAQAQPSHPSNN